MRYFNNFAFISENKDVQGRQRFVARFVSGPYNRLKNLSAAVNETRSAVRILIRMRGLNQLFNLGPVLNKLMQLKRITKGGLGAELPVAGQFLCFCGKNSNFNTISMTFRPFLKPYE